MDVHKRGFWMKKAQTWSLDVMVATGMFVIVIISFFYIIQLASETSKADELLKEGEDIQDILISSKPEESLSIIVGRIVDENKLNDLAKEDYENLKNQLGVRGDFCIHFEDDEGNIIYINKSTNRAGIGSSRVVIGGIACN